MKKIFLTIALSVMALYGYSQESGDIKKFCEINLQEALEFIPKGAEQVYGFDSRADFRLCRVDVPVRMSVIEDDGHIQLQNYWRVPVVFNSKYVSLITVIINDNEEFEIVGLGGHILAEEIQGIRTSGREADVLLRVYSHKIDFVADDDLLDDKNAQHFIPLQSAKNYLHQVESQIDSVYSYHQLSALINNK